PSPRRSRARRHVIGNEVHALLARLSDKIQKYASRPDELQEFYLLVYYGLAVVYNSPVETLTFKFEDAARPGAHFIGEDPGVFDRIFLFVPHNEAQTVSSCIGAEQACNRVRRASDSTRLADDRY